VHSNIKIKVFFFAILCDLKYVDSVSFWLRKTRFIIYDNNLQVELAIFSIQMTVVFEITVYEKNLCMDTKLFDGMDETLRFLEEFHIHWGVVTNKPEFLTLPLMEHLNLTSRACSIVSGDTIKQRKPNPEPLYLAANQCGCLATECIYVGDAERDIVAGNRANMCTLLASYGYIDKASTPVEWGANGVIEHPEEILEWIWG